jgi:hypothetical protein
MKFLNVLPLSACVFLFTAAASAQPGMIHNGKRVASPEAGRALFDDIQEMGSDTDVCYEDNYEDAIEATEKKTKGAITFNLIDVYGESEYPPLDLEIKNDKGELTGAIISPCQ